MPTPSLWFFTSYLSLLAPEHKACALHVAFSHSSIRNWSLPSLISWNVYLVISLTTIYCFVLFLHCLMSVWIVSLMRFFIFLQSKDFSYLFARGSFLQRISLKRKGNLGSTFKSYFKIIFFSYCKSHMCLYAFCVCVENVQQAYLQIDVL